MSEPQNPEDDAMQLKELAGGLPAVDVDPASADRIAVRVRHDLGHGPPKRRLIEAILVGILVACTFGWTLYKAYEALR
ncbi:MAG: hypothetical protein ABJE66_24055 [Deltaproteobacteria bacterium]